MECVHCKGQLVRGTAPTSLTRKGYHVHWDAVPAWVCRQCGEPCSRPARSTGCSESLALLDAETAAFTPAS
jgi:YgiT-type zinc finger domain-containing protein